MVTLIISFFGGYLFLISNTQKTVSNVKWQQITSQKDPAFKLSMPGISRHLIEEAVVKKFKNPIKTASFITDNNGREYMLNIMALPPEAKDLPRKEILKNVLNLLMESEDMVLTSYEPTDEFANFKMKNMSGGRLKQGRIIFRNGYLFMQIVSFKEGNFQENEYAKFIASLTF